MATTRAWRHLMPVAGLVLIVAAISGLIAFWKVVSAIGASRELWLDYILIMIALAALLFAGVSVAVSWLTNRRTNVVPGPALYLFGLAVAILGAEALVLGDTWFGVAGLSFGLLVIFVEYRSDWL